MGEEASKIKSPETTFSPEDDALIIEKILEKYGLKKNQKEGIKKFLESQIPAKRKEIFENLPGSKISELVKEYANGKIDFKNLPLLLEKSLNISGEKAEEIAKELERGVLVFIKPGHKEEKELAPELKPPEKPEAYFGKDSYRESIG